VDVSVDSPEPEPTTNSAGLSCSYTNGSDRMVILRCLGRNAFFLERVVFPFEQLSFQCPSGSDVEIWSHSLGGPELVERFDAEAVSCCCA
jgi:Domain of unknown function (DUF1830)